MNTVRQWWSLPDDYGWNVAYARSKNALGITKTFIGVWCVFYGAASVFGIVVLGFGEGIPGRSTLLFSVVTAPPVGLAWLISGWPSRRMSIAFAVYSDIALAIVLLTVDRPGVALPTAALFTGIGSYLFWFHGPKLFTGHNVLAFVTTVAIYIRAMIDDPGGRPEVTLYAVVLLLVMFGAPLISYSFLMILRRDATGAFYDPLTGLRNRRGFDASIENLRLDTGSTDTVTAVLVDIDRFKAVNDRYGHEHGDTVIRLTAARLLEVFSAPAVTVRLGGEEFAAIVVGDPVAALGCAEDLLGRLRDSTDVSPVTASIGVAHVGVGRENTKFETDRLLDAADRAMYRAKQLGGDRVVESTDG